MPRDEDILQLVSPLCSPSGGPLGPGGGGRQERACSLGSPGGREESEGGSARLALPNRGCQAHPWAGARSVLLHSALLWGRGRRQPRQTGFLPGYLEGEWPSGPCQTGTSLSAPGRHLLAAWPHVRVSLIAGSTHRRPPLSVTPHPTQHTGRTGQIHSHTTYPLSAPSSSRPHTAVRDTHTQCAHPAQHSTLSARHHTHGLSMLHTGTHYHTTPLRYRPAAHTTTHVLELLTTH